MGGDPRPGACSLTLRGSRSLSAPRNHRACDPPVSSIPKAPKGAQTAGRRLWRSVLSEFELQEHELTLLRQAVRVADFCEALQAEVEASGLLVDGRVNPALVEARQQRILLARLIVALRVPLGEDEEAGRTQRRGLRGVYGLRAVQ